MSLCRSDIEKLWISLGVSSDGFKPDDYIKVTPKDWLKITLVEDLPEGVIVIS